MKRVGSCPRHRNRPRRYYDHPWIVTYPKGCRNTPAGNRARPRIGCCLVYPRWKWTWKWTFGPKPVQHTLSARCSTVAAVSAGPLTHNMNFV